MSINEKCPSGSIWCADDDLCALCAAADEIARLTRERDERNATLERVRQERDAAEKARNEWARQCSMASEAQADALNSATAAEAQRDEACAEAGRLTAELEQERTLSAHLQERATAAEARVLDAENVADQMRSQRDAAQEGERRAEARVQELEGALREACDEFKDALGYVPEWAQEKYDYDGTLARLRALLTPTAPASHPPHCRCTPCEQRQALETFATAPAREGEEARCSYVGGKCNSNRCPKHGRPTNLDGRGEVGRG